MERLQSAMIKFGVLSKPVDLKAAMP